MKTMALSRRRFLVQTGALIATPFILPSRLWAQQTSPSRRVTLGCIGMGKHMRIQHLASLVQRDDVEILAVCDVDTTRREHAKQFVEESRSKLAGGTGKGCEAYADFRELLARPDIDAVVVATPDHWHAYIAGAAVRAGKDVYCEKPLTYNIDEAVRLVDAVKGTDRILQTGSQQRSSKEFRVAAELVRNGVIGGVRRVDVLFGSPPRPFSAPAETMEPGLDWDFWCGPGPLLHYSSTLSPRGVNEFYGKWRWCWEFGGGEITDWGAHHIDIAQWALGVDGSGPVEVRAPQDWKSATQGAQLVYADGTVLTHRDGKSVSFFGEGGEVHVGRGQFELILDGRSVHRFWTKEADKGTSMEREVTLTEREYLAEAKIKLPRTTGHMQDFLDSVRERRPPICPVETGASTAIACHLMNFAYRYGAQAKWDPAAHQFTHGGDNAWKSRNPIRGGWWI